MTRRKDLTQGHHERARAQNELEAKYHLPTGGLAAIRARNVRRVAHASSNPASRSQGTVTEIDLRDQHPNDTREEATA